MIPHLVITDHGQPRPAFVSNAALCAELYPAVTVPPGAVATNSSSCRPLTIISVVLRAVASVPVNARAIALPCLDSRVHLGDAAGRVGADREIHPEQVVIRAVRAAERDKDGGGVRSRSINTGA